MGIMHPLLCVLLDLAMTFDIIDHESVYTSSMGWAWEALCYSGSPPFSRIDSSQCWVEGGKLSLRSLSFPLDLFNIYEVTGQDNNEHELISSVC